MVQVYLDVKRTPKDSKGFTIVRTFVDFVDIVMREQVTLLSLDHDLQESRLSLDAVSWLIKKDIFIQYINIHSFSRTGSLLLKKRLEKHFPETVITINCHL